MYRAPQKNRRRRIGERQEEDDGGGVTPSTGKETAKGAIPFTRLGAGGKRHGDIRPNPGIRQATQ